MQTLPENVNIFALLISSGKVAVADWALDWFIYCFQSHRFMQFIFEKVHLLPCVKHHAVTFLV